CTAAAVIEKEERTVAHAIKLRMKLEPVRNFSGTMTLSPGSNLVLRTFPPHQPFCERPIREPFARTMKMSFVFAVGVGPPAALRYQLAVFPGINVIAVLL